MEKDFGKTCGKGVWRESFESFGKRELKGKF